MKKRLISLLPGVIDLVSSLSLEQITQAENYQSDSLKDSPRIFSVLFPAGFLLHSLSLLPLHLRTSQSEKQKELLIRFFTQEVSNFGFNYFTKTFIKSNKSLRLPNDVDDTALILSALQKAGQRIDERAILGLINLESQPGGPYYTWYADGDLKWKDIDPFVNAHIIYFLSLLKINLPNTRQYIFEQLKSDSAKSPYYPYRLFFFMNVAKYCEESGDSEMIEILVQKVSSLSFINCNFTEKLLLLRCKASLKIRFSRMELDFLTGIAQKDFTQFQPAIVCYDFARQKQMTYTVSKIFTAALWIEIVSMLSAESEQHTSSEKFGEYFREIHKTLHQYISSEDIQEVETRYPFKETTIPLLLPLFISQMAQSETESRDKRTVCISAAAYLGWVGFTDIDSLVDSGTAFKNASKPFRFVELGLKILQTLLPEKKYKMFHKKLFALARETLDWYQFEAKNRLFSLKKEQFPPYLRGTHIIKKTKSFLYILSSIPFLLQSPDIHLQKSILNLLTSIMIIRQLGDDAHDWKEDMKENTPTIATVQLREKDPDSQETVEFYWERISPQIVKKCDYHWRKAKKIIAEHTQLRILEPFLKKAYAPIIELKREQKGIKKIMKFIAPDS